MRLLFQKLISLLQAIVLYLQLNNPLLRVISAYISRNGGSSQIKSSDKMEGDFETRGCCKISEEEEEEEEESVVYLKFKFPSYAEFTSGKGVIDDRESDHGSSFKCEESLMDDETNAFSVKESAKVASNLCENEKGEKVLSFHGKESDVKTAVDTEEEVKSSDSDSELSSQDQRETFDDIEDSEEMESSHNEYEFTDDSSSKLSSGEDFSEISSSVIDEPKILNDREEVKNDEEEEELECLWEHQDLIEQLKMEIKRVRATGLPTILEESESPKMFDDLRPWKIDEFQRQDCIGELRKFYKCYRAKMRKFDIMNYQKMYAMGFLQLKDDLLGATSKPKAPVRKSLVPRKLWLCRHKIHGNDPAKKLVEELNGDLEMVYVGQMCLSWEFLHWQYEKVCDLWQSDSRGTRTFNEVASEFQQFQVLLQRFVEDEAFQGPRVQNYVKSRCIFRNLLQVPVIRDDNKSNAKRKGRDEYAITSDMLVEILEESIRIFWRFVRADKDCSVAAINSCKKVPGEEHKLVVETKRTLQKKEKKLIAILRSENCIMRKLRQCREGNDSNQVQCFFSQVDMALVARVLNMSNITTDQLIWCHNKLNRISFSNGSMHTEPSFLLFPC